MPRPAAVRPPAPGACGASGLGAADALLGHLGGVLADGADDLGTLEQAETLLLVGPVLQVRVVENFVYRTSLLVLPDHVGGQAVFLGHRALPLGLASAVFAALEESLKESHCGDCILGAVQRDSEAMRFAERVVHGVGDDGAREEILVWIERRPGAVWAVGRTIDLKNRAQLRPRSDDYVFEGYELGDALEAANNALTDDLRVSAGEGVDERVEPFTEEELLKPLERWFFGRS